MAIIPDSLEQQMANLSANDAHSAIDQPTLPPIGTAIEFRVVRPGVPVRRLRLTGNRYTFGSGEGCSIRLDDETLRPMHAVLLRDAHRILMRAYSIPIECNGDRVTESVLRVGDIIRMGGYRFELLAAPGDSLGPLGNAAGPLRATASNPQNTFQAQETHLRDRLTELSQQWHARHAECEVRESRCDQRESELHGRETELWGRAENLQQRESLLVAQEAAAHEIQQTYAATQEELRELRERESEANEALTQKESELVAKSKQLLERQAELERRQAEWQQREEQYAERAAQAQRKLEQTQQQAQSASDAVGRMREEFATLNEQLTELRERHSELQERERREQVEHERLRGELEDARDEAIDARAKTEAARTATEAELERVGEDLRVTRQEITKIRQESQACQADLTEKLRATGQELQAAREEAENSRRAAEEEQAYAENRVSELEERLSAVQENREQCDDETREKIDSLQRQYEIAEHKRLATEKLREESDRKRQAAEDGRQGAEEVAEELRNNIKELQKSVAQANQEASQLRAEYDGSTASIRQLELLVDQTKNNQTAQQDSWADESEQLRATIEGLSVELANANAALSQLKSTNEALSSELAESQENVAEGQAAAQKLAIDSQQFQVLEQELESAQKEIQRLQDTHTETVSRLEAERQESELALRDEIEQLRDEIANAQEAAEARVQAIIDAQQQAFNDTDAIQPDAHAETGSVALEPVESGGALDVVGDEVQELVAPEIALTDESQPLAEHDHQVKAQQIHDSESVAPADNLESPAEPDESSHDFATNGLANGSVTEDRDASTPFQAETEVTAATDQLVESGDSVWRMESQQSVENQTHLSDWSEHESGNDAVSQTDGDADWSESQWSEADYPADAAIDPNQSGLTPSDGEPGQAENESGVSWHDERPENVISDAIDDIEHNVEQAITDYEQPAESNWTATSDDVQSEVTEDPVSETESVADLQNEQSSGAVLADNDAIEHDDSPNRMSDSDIVRQFSSRDNIDPETPLDWSAYMPGGDPHSPNSEPESEVLAEAEGTEVGEWGDQTEPEIDPNQQLDDATDETAGTSSFTDAVSEEPSEVIEILESDEAPPELSESSWGQQEIEAVAEQETPTADESGDELNEAEDVGASTWATQSWDQTPQGEAAEIETPQTEAIDVNSNEANSNEANSIEANEFESVSHDATQHWGGLSSDDVAAEDAIATDEVTAEDNTFEELSEEDIVAVAIDDDPSDTTEELESDDEIGQATGSLAAMLIRDLTGDTDHETETTSDATTATNEAGDEDATYLMSQAIDVSDQAEETSESWSFESPQEPQAETPIADSYAAEPEQSLSSLSESAADQSQDHEYDDSGYENAGHDEPVDDQDDVSQTAVANPSDTVAVSSEAPPEDDSIEAYMSRLLQRVQTDETEDPVEKVEAEAETQAPAETESQQLPEVEEPVVETTMEESFDSVPEAEPISDTAPLVPRSQAPELTRNLSAMRDLANQSARNAVARSIRIQARDTQLQAFRKGLVAASFLAMAIGVYFYVIWWSGAIKFLMIAMLLVLAILTGIDAFNRANDARRRLALAEHNTGDAKDDQEIAEQMQRIADQAEAK